MGGDGVRSALASAGHKGVGRAHAGLGGGLVGLALHIPAAVALAGQVDGQDRDDDEDDKPRCGRQATQQGAAGAGGRDDARGHVDHAGISTRVRSQPYTKLSLAGRRSARSM